MQHKSYVTGGQFCPFVHECYNRVSVQTWYGVPLCKFHLDMAYILQNQNFTTENKSSVYNFLNRAGESFLKLFNFIPTTTSQTPSICDSSFGELDVCELPYYLLCGRGIYHAWHDLNCKETLETGVRFNARNGCDLKSCSHKFYGNASVIRVGGKYLCAYSAKILLKFLKSDLSNTLTYKVTSDARSELYPDTKYQISKIRETSRERLKNHEAFHQTSNNQAGFDKSIDNSWQMLFQILMSVNEITFQRICKSRQAYKRLHVHKNFHVYDLVSWHFLMKHCVVESILIEDLLRHCAYQRVALPLQQINCRLGKFLNKDVLNIIVEQTIRLNWG